MTAVGPYVSNPFSVLGLRSDASPKEIARISDRFLKWIEVGETPQVVESLPFLAPAGRDRENIKYAASQIENPRTRIQHELFWPAASNSHFQFCCEHLIHGRYDEFVSLCEHSIAKADIHEGRGKPISSGERLDASLCRHFLAIFFHSAAISSSAGAWVPAKGVHPTGDWHRALQCWVMVCRDDVFWEYISDRAKHLNDPRMAGFDVAQTRHELPHRLLEVNSFLGLASLEQRKLEEFVSHARVIRKSPFDGSERDPALKKLTAPLVSQFQKALSEVAPLLSESAARERTSSLKQLAGGGFEGTIDPDKFLAYFSFVKGQLEKRMIPIGELIQRAVLGGTDDGRELLDGVAYSLRRFSLAVNNVGDMPQRALELTKTARRFAKSPECAERLVEDERALQFLVLQSEAINAADAKQYDQAILKLEESRKYATPEEQKTVDEWIETTRKRAVLGNTKPINSVPTMYTFNGIGTTLYGKRAFDKSTQTYIATLFFVVLFFPVFPIAAYRVRNAGGNQYQFFGKVPLSKWAFAAPGIILGVILLMMASGAFDSPTTTTSPSSPYYSTPSSSPSYVPPAAQSIKSQLGTWIDKERARIDAEKVEVDSMGDELDREQLLLKSQRSALGSDATEDEIDQFNAALRRFKAKVDTYNERLGKLKEDAKKFDTQVHRYNSMQ
jgi:hypothetical protein